MTLYPSRRGWTKGPSCPLQPLLKPKASTPWENPLWPVQKEQAPSHCRIHRLSNGGRKGIRAQVAGRNLLCGHEKYLTENGVVIGSAILAKLEHLRTQGKASVLLAEGARCLGILAMSDVLRPEAKAMVEQLAAMHVSTVLLTGRQSSRCPLLCQPYRYFDGPGSTPARGKGIVHHTATRSGAERMHDWRRRQRRAGSENRQRRRGHGQYG